MIGVTHIAFSSAIGLLVSSEPSALIYMAIGSVLPDVDHPKSAVGRLLAPLSSRIYKRFGHRSLTHSILLWLPLTLLCFNLNKACFYMAFGAITHIFLDCVNASGVSLFYPISDKSCVFGSKKYRIGYASREEWVLLLFLVIINLSLLYVSEKGGIKTCMARAIASYSSTLHQYKKQGKRICYIEGTLRYLDGETKKGRWLVVGLSKHDTLTIYDESQKKGLVIPTDAQFLRAYLQPSEQRFSLVELKTFQHLESKNPAFNLVEGQWIALKKGDLVIGSVIYTGSIRF